MVNSQQLAEVIAEKSSLTPGDVHNVIRNLMTAMRKELLNSRSVRLEGLGTFTMKACTQGHGVMIPDLIKIFLKRRESMRCSRERYLKKDTRFWWDSGAA